MQYIAVRLQAAQQSTLPDNNVSAACVCYRLINVTDLPSSNPACTSDTREWAKYGLAGFILHSAPPGLQALTVCMAVRIGVYLIKRDSHSVM